jgi:hypothetical protein
MIDRESKDRGGPESAKFLLHEKQRELRTLELRHSRKLIFSEDYDSCRRSLLQAMEPQNLTKWQTGINLSEGTQPCKWNPIEFPRIKPCRSQAG